MGGLHIDITVAYIQNLFFGQPKLIEQKKTGGRVGLDRKVRGFSKYHVKCILAEILLYYLGADFMWLVGEYAQ